MKVAEEKEREDEEIDETKVRVRKQTTEEILEKG